MNPSLSINASYNPYELLRVYAYYRTLLGGLLLVMFQAHIIDRALGVEDPQLFFYTCVIYTVFNVVTLILLWHIKFSPSIKQLFSLLLVDIAAIILLMHSSGGAPSAFGYLLLVAAAAGGMLLRGQIAIFLAALTSIAVISETIYRVITNT
ncbi:MAG: histidine kinase, partial [Moraxellaceae bacterium]